MVFVAANITLAHPVTSWLSLGGGVSIMGSSAGSTTQANNLGPDNPDAKLQTDADGVGFGLIASAMIEFSPRTRFTATWNSETEPSDDVTVKLKRSTLPRRWLTISTSRERTSRPQYESRNTLNSVSFTNSKTAGLPHWMRYGLTTAASVSLN